MKIPVILNELYLYINDDNIMLIICSKSGLTIFQEMVRKHCFHKLSNFHVRLDVWKLFVTNNSLEAC